MKQEFITIALPFAERSEFNPLREKDVIRMVEKLGNPARQSLRSKPDKTGLDDAGILHFMSINVIGAMPDDPSSFILIEATVDGRADDGIAAIERAMGDELYPIVALACDIRSRGSLFAFLRRHSRQMSRNPLHLPGKIAGFGFLGTPGLSVAEIRRNQALFQGARNRIAELRDSNAAMGPQTILGQVHKHILSRDDLRPLLEVPQSPLSFVETSKAPWLKHLRDPQGKIAAWLGVSVQWLALLLLAPLLVSLVMAGMAEAIAWPPSPAKLVHVIMVAVFPAMLFVVIEIGVVLLLLRRSERANLPLDIDPDPATLAAVMERENDPSSLQNHMISTTVRLPGLLRRMALLFAFYAIAMAGKLGLMRSGFLANLGTIHSARWVVMPGTRKLIFVSNYDGSWESYLEDFITKACEGTTGVWGNAVGFPVTRLLFLEGAKDGDRFKRFARRSMQPTAFWYSAYPDLTCEQIRKQAIVVNGLHHAEILSRSPLDAEAWLDQFSTIPRPEYALEYDEIQTLMFGGLKRHKSSACCEIGFGPPQETSADKPHPYDHVQRWLCELLKSHEVETDRAKRKIMPRIDFGNKPPASVATNIAFSASGLRKLGLDAELGYSGAGFAPGPGDPPGFPLAFAAGMAHPSRKRLLSDPDTLDWTDQEADAVLLVYAGSPAELDLALGAAMAQAKTAGVDIRNTIRTELRAFDSKAFYDKWHYHRSEGSAGKARQSREQAYGKDELMVEPFGFVDGISQPRIRGFPGRSGQSDPIHDVEPGEFILGYTDNRGYYPPSPMLARDAGGPGMQARRTLPYGADDQPQRFPDFGNARAGFGRPRDFGRNGSYLVIRQLAQNVGGFDAQLNSLMKTLVRPFAHKRSNLDDIETLNPHLGNRRKTEEWLAAKFVGRWRNGSSLVANPHEPAFGPTQASRIDNNFLFKDEDPQGLRCPLGAHVRRTFPRDSLSPEDDVELSVTNRHRLLRRGRPYLDAKGEPAGTLFMCFNADIERQFEFVQQTWMGSPSFHGLDGEVDPFAMHSVPPGDASDRGAQIKPQFVIQGPAAPLCLKGIKSFVGLKGGGYFFLPGRHALWFLAGRAWLVGDASRPQLPPAG